MGRERKLPDMKCMKHKRGLITHVGIYDMCESYDG